jgi:multisubunit Na+/H+ antiporter MnhC subunit|tara:strand:- start:1137 stop:1331 length:195 start_codon:yes stop_codon:yes gene_type:complete
MEEIVPYLVIILLYILSFYILIKRNLLTGFWIIFALLMPGLVVVAVLLGGARGTKPEDKTSSIK